MANNDEWRKSQLVRLDDDNDDDKYSEVRRN